MINQKLKVQVAEATRLFWGKGLSTGRDGGDVSIRDPKTKFIYICPQTNKDFQIKNWGCIKAENIAVIKEDGTVVDKSYNILPTIEAPMHLLIYKKRSDVNAIVHSHAVCSSAFAITGKDIPLALVESAAYGSGSVVCAKYGRVGSVKLAENVLEALGKKKKAALLRNHGAVCVGKDIEEAFVVSDFLENTAKVIILGTILGKVISIKVEDILDESLANLEDGLI